MLLRVLKEIFSGSGCQRGNVDVVFGSGKGSFITFVLFGSVEA